MAQKFCGALNMQRTSHSLRSSSLQEVAGYQDSDL